MRRAVHRPIETPRTVRVRTAQGVELRLAPEVFQIVGIVGDVRHLSLLDVPHPEMFLSYAQMATTEVTFLLRGTARDTDLARAARNAIWAVDRDQPLAAVRTMNQLISDDVAPRRFVLLLLGVFAGVALLLSAAGIFAVVLRAVSQRTREIGIRMALGAGAAAVVRAVVGRTLFWMALGIVAGADPAATLRCE
jgi:putative ABC transport system permease protein